MDWLSRKNTAIDVMEKRMSLSLNIDEIAKSAYSSSFHFQRMFNMLTGMTVAQYVRNRIFTLAAQELATTSIKVVDVAMKYGYDSPESFSKAFKKIHGISPSEARQPNITLKAFPRISIYVSLKGDKQLDYKIVEQEAYTVVGKKLRCHCEGIDSSQKITELWNQSYLDGTVEYLYEISSDKNLVGISMEMDYAEEQFTYMIATKVKTDSHVSKEGFELYTIPQSKWAVFTSQGPVPTGVQYVISRIYQEWFPSTQYEHSGAPEMEVYLPGDIHANDYSCEIWVPFLQK